MTAEITGFPWLVFPINCHDVFRGVTPYFQDTPFRVRHFSETPDTDSLNPGGCVLFDYAVNGLLVLTDDPVPPLLPDGWMFQQVSLDNEWEVCTGLYTIRVLRREATVEGDRYTFKATPHGEKA